MKHTVCDICGEQASATFSIRRFPVGSRPILIGYESGAAAKFIDLCPEHQHLISNFLTPKGAIG